MPPVFGPLVTVADPLEVLRRLQRQTVVPSVIANSETSGPSRYSSITTRSQAAAWASAASRSSVTTTPLPAASPSSLTTYGGPNSSSAAADLVGGAQTRASAVGTPAAAITSLAKALEPSSCAASADGPKQPRCPPSRTASATPATSGASGPDHDQVDAERGRQAGDRLPVERVDGVQRRDRGDARVAGAACTSSTSGSRASARARACSRPPVPMTRIFTGSGLGLHAPGHGLRVGTRRYCRIGSSESSMPGTTRVGSKTVGALVPVHPRGPAAQR